MAITPNAILENLIVEIEKRKPTFGKAVVCVALVQNEQNNWMVGYGLITFLGKGDPLENDQKLDYGNFVLIKKSVDISEAVSLLRSVFEKQILKLDDYPDIPIKVPIYRPNSIPSQGQHASNQWPMLFTSSSIDSNTTRQLSYDALSKLGLPLFPNGTEAVINFFGMKRLSSWQNISPNFEVNVPDFRARIRNLRLAGNRATIEVETRELSESDLRAKFYCKTEDRAYISDDLPFEKGRATFVAEKEPFIVEAHILSTIDGDNIDRRNFDYRYPSKEGGVIIENSEIQLLDMINKGESETVEFKVTLDPKNAKEFLESVVAFANTRGGTIFLGVDDNCRIRDFREDAQARIVDLIHGNCDPPVEVQVRQATLAGEHQITIVEVSEGQNKPYSLNNKGIFIRSGSSDRQIKRTELDDIYDKKKQGYSVQRY